MFTMKKTFQVVSSHFPVSRRRPERQGTGFIGLQSKMSNGWVTGVGDTPQTVTTTRAPAELIREGFK